MGSGYFPLDKSSSKTSKLMEAGRLIEEVRDSLWDAVYSGEDGQFDNAASDGGYLQQLGIAANLIYGCCKKE